MRNISLAIIVSTGLVGPSYAGMMGLGGMYGGHPGGGRGLGGYNTEAVQNHFEDSFSALVTEYDEGLTAIDDYYNSGEYSDLVDDVEWLSDRYSFFLKGVDRTLERYDSLLTSLNDEITYFDDLLAKYQANEDLSDERLERIESWVTAIQDVLSLKAEIITEKQSLLAENYATYTTFGSEISTYLDTIVAAGGGITNTDETAAESTGIAATAMLYASAPTVAACEEAFSSAVVVPEPQGFALLLLASLGFMSRRLRHFV
jgi:CHASE3 domain sensor protein